MDDKEGRKDEGDEEIYTKNEVSRGEKVGVTKDDKRERERESNNYAISLILGFWLNNKCSFFRRFVMSFHDL